MLIINHLGTLQDLYHRQDVVAPSSEIHNANIKSITQWEFTYTVVTFHSMINRLRISF